MHLLWPEEMRHDDVLLFLSDAAPYMVKSGKSIQIFYPKVIRVTCIVHGLHLIAEKIRANYCKVENVNKVFLKAPYRVAIFKDKAPNILLPPAPILTRWGTWIRAAVYYCEHLEIIKSIVNSLNKEDAISIAKSQKYFRKQALRQI
ncbi:Ribonuclease H-like domain [Cinara cedri]|uniref:Ribonuclease H-like domain n=1 Tax=Cinara cedri TaxID=506608 RepID=A0A5E4MAP1_9HEMI|nr:Ribonuclease H-like domain [Cinara cedri]